MLSLCRDFFYSSPSMRTFSFYCMKTLGLFSSIDEITDFLYISGLMAATEENLDRLGIDSVVDVSNIVPADRPNKQKVDRIEVQVDDTSAASLKPYFDLVSDKIKENKDRNVKTLVHCVAGVSRSATLCIVYFVKHEKLTLKEAYDKVKGKRSIVSPNIAFWKQMIEYEAEIHGSTSVNIVKRNFCEIPDLYLKS